MFVFLITLFFVASLAEALLQAASAELFAAYAALCQTGRAILIATTSALAQAA
jgi:hypothetical protein